MCGAEWLIIQMKLFLKKNSIYVWFIITLVTFIEVVQRSGIVWNIHCEYT